MPSINNPIINNTRDPTAAVFETFYDPPGDYPVEAGLYDTIVSYFIQQSRSPYESRRLTDTVFRVAQATGVPATQIFDDIRNRRNTDIENQINFYLNQLNSRTTLQGYSSTIQSNFFVARTILD